MDHITQAKRKLRDLLKLRLPSVLMAADLAAGDGIHTPPPYEVHTTDKADIGGLPSVELIADSSTRTIDSFAAIYRHRLVIGVTVGGDDEETMTAQLERYVWCLRKIAKDTHLVPVEGTGPVDTGGEQYTPLLQRPQTTENPLVKGAFIETFITTVE